MIKEIFAGTALGVVIFLLLLGYDIVPFLLVAGLAYFLFVLMERKGLTGSGGQFGITAAPAEFSFDDIGGQGPAKLELKEALDFVLHVKEVAAMGIRPLKGILLTGPPGTGKTLLAKASAAYTHSLFLAASGSEFVEVYAGVGAQRVRQLFRNARERAKKEKRDGAIIFIDEIDVLGSKRGSNASHMEYDQTLNQLLVEMDGLHQDDETRILVIAATNRDDMLDPAILRPGRFDRIVRVDLPDKEGRYEILKIHTRNKPLAADVRLDELAQETFGFSGAHLESLANEAAILAFREGKHEISLHNFKEAMDKVMMGEKLERKPDPDELRRIAIHESGHAIMSEWVRPGSVSHLTITNRGKALGYMRQIPERDLYLYTRDYLDKQIQMLLAGAIAERVVLHSQSTGASNDFQQAMDLARRIITAGLSKLGVVCEEMLSQELFHDTMQEIIREQEQVVEQVLVAQQERLQSIAAQLLEKEYLSGDQLRQLIPAADGEAVNS